MNAKKPRRVAYAKDDHVHLLKGVLKCGECETALTPYPSGKKDKDGRPYLYYACGKVVDSGKDAPCKVRMLPARDFEEVIKQALRELGQNKALITSTIKGNARFNQQRLKPLQEEKDKTEHRLITTIKEINRLIKLMKSQDLVGKEITEEYKKLLAERNALETEKEKLQLEIERCSQDMLDAERIAETLLAFDRVVKALSLEDQKELFQLLIKEARVWSFDPAKENAPREHGAFITKIRTRWYRIKLSLYQFPGIEAYYRSLAQRKASSGITGNWLPFVHSFRTWLTLPPWEREPALWGLYHPQESERNLIAAS